MCVTKRTIILIFAVVGFSGFLFAKPPERKGINYLERDLNFVEESSELSLLPDFEGRSALLRDLKKFKPSGVVELLYTMPLPEIGERDLMLHILQSISAVSTLEGIVYYSGSRKQKYPYLEEA